jgi:8-oxo-dGTP pyrophosphatase MutT (NUDIX family)
MGITISGHNLNISLKIPLPRKYRGGGVAVFRINNGQPEVLLGLRANNPGRGLWTFPGGGAEGKEKLSAAAVREFREETGVQLYGRYITRTGLFQVNNPFFEWNTLIIESTQNINTDKRLSSKLKMNNSETLWDRCFIGEFISLRWIFLSDIENIKLHRWVKEVIDLYTNGIMKPYKAKPPKGKSIALPSRKKTNRAKTVQRVSGENLLFDMAEMVLARVDRDGTKYFQPSCQVKNKSLVVQEDLYGL